MQTLFEISDEMFEFDQLMTDLDGEIPEGEVEAKLDAWFAALKDRRDEKLDNYAALMKTLEARAKVRREESARLAALATADENAHARLKHRLNWFFETHQLDPVQTRRFKIALQKNGGVAPLILDEAAENDPASLPEGFRRVKFEADKNAIRAALEGDDEELKETIGKFAKIGERGKSIRIR